MTDQNNYSGFVAFHRRSRYDMLQARTESGWGPVWTFAPCDVRAAERAGRMLCRMGIQRVRHSRRARLRRGERDVSEVVVVSDLPGREQIVLHLEDGSQRAVSRYMSDECLKALETALTGGARSIHHAAGKLVIIPRGFIGGSDAHGPG